MIITTVPSSADGIMIPVGSVYGMGSDAKRLYSDVIRYYTNLKVPGIMYHRITSDPNLQSTYSISPQMLREDFETIKAMGYTPITLSEYSEIVYGFTSLKDGKSDLNTIHELISKYPNPILITADDGYLGIYTDFMPLLKEFNFKANFMIFGEVIDEHNPEYVTWEQIKEMQQSGLVEFGNHTYSLHSYPKQALMDLYRSDPEFCRKDIELNRTKLEAATGVKCDAFAYPYGGRNMSSNAVIDSCGYQKILNTDYRTNVLTSGIYNVSRVNRDNKTPSWQFFGGLWGLKTY